MMQGIYASDSRCRTALHLAVEQNDEDLLVQALQAGADVEACTVAGNTALHLAAKAGHAHLFRYLRTPTTLNCQNSQGYTPLQTALLYKQWLAAAVLVAHGASPYGPGPTPSLSSLASPLDAAPEPTLLLKALLADPSPTGPLAQALSWRDSQGCTALHLYALLGEVQSVANLVAAGADRDALTVTPCSGYSALHLAAAAGYTQLVPLLVTPKTLDRDMLRHGTPVYSAAAGGHVDTVEALLAAGAHPDTQEDVYNSRTALVIAARNGHMPVVAVLLRALASMYGAQKGPSQQQQGQQQQQQQQQQQEEQHLQVVNTRQPELIERVASVVFHLGQKLEDAPRCAQLVEGVLDVLGPGVAGEVCREVQIMHQYPPGGQERNRWPNDTPGPAPFLTTLAVRSRNCYYTGGNYLAEALLLGWLGAEGQRRIPARLQRLVPGVGVASQQGRQQAAQGRLEQLVEAGIIAAASQRQRQASDLLGQCAELYVQHSAKDCSRAGVPAPHPPALSPVAAQQGQDPLQLEFLPSALTTGGLPPPHTEQDQACLPPVVQLVHAGLMAAVVTQDEERSRRMQAGSSMEGSGLNATSEEVHHAFLSAWLAARAAPTQELVGAVVAAVKVAQQQQQQQQQAALLAPLAAPALVPPPPSSACLAAVPQPPGPVGALPPPLAKQSATTLPGPRPPLQQVPQEARTPEQ